MKILIIGSGGREHAIGFKLSQSSHKPELFFAPGNPGTETLGQRLEIEASDIQGLYHFAIREKIDLTIVGPEIPLALGIADLFREKGLLIFGPSQAGAKVESSKAYAKTLMVKAGIPTAGYQFCSSRDDALKALNGYNAPYVIKEDALAAGKGVTIAKTRQEAEQAIESAFAKQIPVIVEEFLEGEELSVLAICDGKKAIPMVAAQDFKRIADEDQGPNTGGMGAYAPVPFADKTLMSIIETHILNPMLQIMQEEKIDYRGVLYAGLIKTTDHEIKVIEFNARFGDPETQVILPLLQDDLADVLLAASNGDLRHYYDQGFNFKAGYSAVTVVLAAQGYPGQYQTGDPITIPSTISPSSIVFQAGTKRYPDQSIVTAGGRVLNATGIGKSLDEARTNAYQLANTISYKSKYYRQDIAEKAVKNLKTSKYAEADAHA